MQRNAFLFSLLLFFVAAVFGQEYRGAITGVVSDASGTPIAGAKVTATETATQTKVTVTTDNAGAYTAGGLLPGDYEVRVQQTGFKEFTRRGIRLGAGERP